jgi:membrane protease YdiL (CAAX protease family)
LIILASIAVALLMLVAFIYANERYGLLSSDHFPSAVHKWVAYAWFGLLLVGMTAMVTIASVAPAAAPVDMDKVPFWTLFTSHITLMIFLTGWWLLAGRPPITDYMNLQRREIVNAIGIGVAVGVGGWALTLGLAGAIGWLLQMADLIPDNLEPSPMIPWMAALPLWQKGVIVLMAMTVEEFFFRAWLQKRVGLIISTVIFALAHAGYGQPLMLIGITIVSFIIGYTFYRTRNLWPCIIAHGVFDAIQLFVIVPLALELTGGGLR